MILNLVVFTCPLSRRQAVPASAGTKMVGVIVVLVDSVPQLLVAVVPQAFETPGAKEATMVAAL